MSARVYCSEQNPGEPMIGTADPVDVWLLLEYSPAWPARAIQQSSLGSAVRDWLDAALAALADAGLRARPQFIRRPELDGSEVHLFLGLPDGLVRFSGADYRFLDNVDPLAVARRPEHYPQVTEAHYFVCTNGQRDLCCARFGLPVYAALRERVGGRAWQITHLGGHRFAPNVLALPQGVLYGRLQETALDDFVATVEAGGLAFEQMRGRSWLPPAAQAAEALSGRADLTFVASEEDGAATTVWFDGGDERLAVTVRRGEPLAVLKSCGDAQAAPVTPYRPA